MRTKFCCELIVLVVIYIIILLVEQVLCQEELPSPAIIFYSDSAEQPGIYLLELDSNWKPIFLGQGKAPVWSPDGKKIAFCDNGIGVMDADGRNQKMLTFNSSDRKPAFSPDGNKICFHSDIDGDYDIYVMDVSGKNLRNLTKTSDDERNPAWSPDGGKIAFECFSQEFNLVTIATMDANGKNKKILTKLQQPPGIFPINISAYHNPDWSPDGTKIVCHGLVDREEEWGIGALVQEIIVMNSDGTGIEILTKTQGNDESPAWSPDGKKIAFHSDRDGNDEIYIMNVDGTNQERITTNPAMDEEPDWHPLWGWEVNPSFDKFITIWGKLKKR